MNFQNKKFLVLIFLSVIGFTYLFANFLFNNSTPQVLGPSIPVPESGPPESSNTYFHTLGDQFKIPQAISIAPPASFSELAKKVQPAVVNISTTHIDQTQPMRGVDPFFRDFFGVQPQPQQKEGHSLGSGFIVNEKGLVLTNNHVVEGADEIIVKLTDGRELKATLVGRDPHLDLAVLRLPEGAYTAVPLGNSDTLEIGDWVVAVGNPFGLGQTVTAGIVSAKERNIGAGPYDDFIQTDASINPGNSGGPLFNTQGEVVGIDTAILAAGQGLGFAIPINMVKEVITPLVEQGFVTRGWMGVAIGNVTPELVKRLGLAGTHGALVTQVVPGGPADQAGVTKGDVILSMNQTPIDNSHMLPTLVSKSKPGSTVQIVIIREGKQYERNITLGSLDKPEESINQNLLKLNVGIGLTVRDLSPSEKRMVRNGVVVAGVAGNSLAQAVGLRSGDLILEINGQTIMASQQLKAMLGRVPQGRVIQMALARGNQVYYFSFRKE